MVVQIDACGLAPAAVPAKDEPPLLVDTDRMQALQIAPQLFEMIAGRHSQIPIRCRVVDHLNLAEQTGHQIGGNLLRSDILDKEIVQPVLAKAHDHSADLSCKTVPLYGTTCNAIR